MKKIVIPLLIIFYSCNLDDVYKSNEQAKLITKTVELKITKDSLYADGVSTAMIELTIDSLSEGDKLKDEYKVIQIQCDQGLFHKNKNNNLEVSLVQDNEDPTKYIGKALVCGPTKIVKPYLNVYTSIENVTITDSVELFKAYPDSLILNASKFAVINHSSDEITITGQLTRKIGIPTQGQEVAISILDNDGNQLIENIHYRSEQLHTDKNGHVSITISFWSIDYFGPVMIKGETLIPGDEIRDSITIDLISPPE